MPAKTTTNRKKSVATKSAAKKKASKKRAGAKSTARKTAATKVGPAKTSLAQSVDSYLASLPENTRQMLEKVRAAIMSAAPKAEELISYRIPTYKYHGPLVHFMAHPEYCSFIVTNRATVEKFKSELTGFGVSGTTIHFTVDQPLPSALVKKIVRARVKENESSS